MNVYANILIIWFRKQRNASEYQISHYPLSETSHSHLCKPMKRLLMYLKKRYFWAWAAESVIPSISLGSSFVSSSSLELVWRDIFVFCNGGNDKYIYICICISLLLAPFLWCNWRFYVDSRSTSTIQRVRLCVDSPSTHSANCLSTRILIQRMLFERIRFCVDSPSVV